MSLRDLTILQYHNVCRQPELSQMWLSLNQFKQQLDYLKCDPFTILSMDQAIDYMCKRFSPNGLFPISLTFDNGFLDFHSDVFPLLVSERIPATVLLSPKKVEKSIILKGRKVSYLNWAHLRELIDAGVTIGAFEDDRLSIKDVPRDDLIQHISSYKKILEDKLGTEIRYFGAKEGVPDKGLQQTIRTAGYRAFLTQCPTNTRRSLYAIGRIQVDDEDFNIFLTKISKSYLFFKDRRIWKYIRKYKLDRAAHHISEAYNDWKERRTIRNLSN